MLEVLHLSCMKVLLVAGTDLIGPAIVDQLRVCNLQKGLGNLNFPQSGAMSYFDLTLHVTSYVQLNFQTMVRMGHVLL